MLNNISITFKEGEIVGLAGANGSGKSTLLSILNGNTKPTAGILKLDNLEINNFNNLPFAFIQQENNLFEDLSVKDNIKFWECVYDNKCKKNFFNEEEQSLKVAFLSGGQKKLLSIMIGLIGEPRFLFFDEPTSSLDMVYQNKIMDIIQSLKNQGKGVIISSHYVDELFLCDKLIVLESSKIVISQSPKNIGDIGEVKRQIIQTIKGEQNGKRNN